MLSLGLTGLHRFTSELVLSHVRPTYYGSGWDLVTMVEAGVCETFLLQSWILTGVMLHSTWFNSSPWWTPKWTRVTILIVALLRRHLIKTAPLPLPHYHFCLGASHHSRLLVFGFTNHQLYKLQSVLIRWVISANLAKSTETPGIVMSQQIQVVGSFRALSCPLELVGNVSRTQRGLSGV